MNILIAYDGSEDAKAAVDHAAELMPGSSATVLTVWAPVIDVLIAPYDYPQPKHAKEIDAESESNAAELAEEGSERAREAGLDATPSSRPRLDSVAETLLAEADEVGAATIVVGTRGRPGLKSLFLGSVSHTLLHQADRPVVVVPSQTVAARRSEQRHHVAAG